MVGIDLPLEPQRQQLIDIEPRSPWPLDRTTVADHVQLLYIIPRKGGNAHIGGHYFGKNADPDNYDAGVDQEYVEDVTERAVKRVPSLKDAKVLRGYSALYDNTPDTYPIVGESHQVPGFYNCLGWSGHGFKHGPVFGKVMAELISTGKTSLDIGILDVDRFQTGHLIKTAEGVKAPFG
jgi:sarcosine oxidase subunit beta